MSESQNENPPAKEGEQEHKTPTKRTPSKRMSIIERAQRESEELIKNMGGSLDVEGGRRTRSSARGGTAPSTPSTPPPAKKARSSTTPRRGRPKKNETEVNNDEKAEKGEPTTPKKADSADVTDDKKDQIENCMENDVTADEKKEIVKSTEDEKNSEKSEVDAKSSNDEKLECISEESETKDEEEEEEEEEDEKNSQSGKPAETVKIESEKKSESVPATKLDPVEPMEVDGSAQNAEEKSSAESKENLPLESTNNEVADDGKPSDVHENSIDKSSEPTIEDNKVDESKTGNDVCEPKISSPTNTGDVVAAQTCN